MATIETLNGPLDTSELGTVLMHEHVFNITAEIQIAHPGFNGWDPEVEVPKAREELRAATHETIVRNSLRSCYIRPLVYRGAGPMGLYPLDSPVEVAIAVWEWGAYLGDEGKQRGVRGNREEARPRHVRRVPGRIRTHYSGALGSREG